MPNFFVACFLCCFQDVSPVNLALLTEQYVWRSIINIDRENNMDQKGNTRTLKVHLLNCCTKV